MDSQKEKQANVKDEALRDHLKKAFDSDDNLRPYGLRVDVVRGEAQVQGIVDTLSEKRHAEELARSVAGIRNVANAISISTDGPITDSEVEFEVSEELEADPNVDTKHIGAKSSHGVVTLVGNVEDATEIRAAKEAAAKARGVTEVVSEVRVTDPETTPEGLFHSQVRNDGEDARNRSAGGGRRRRNRDEG